VGALALDGVRGMAMNHVGFTVLLGGNLVVSFGGFWYNKWVYRLVFY